MSTAVRACPDCGREIPVVERFPDWCDGCGWNLRPSGYRSASDADDLYLRMSRRFASRLASELVQTQNLTP